MSDISTLVDDVPLVRAQSSSVCVTALDIILTAARSSSGWVRLSSCDIIAPRRIQALGHGDVHLAMHLLDNDNIVERNDWISVPANSTIEEARQWILDMRKGERGRAFLKGGTILGIVDQGGRVSGVVEIEDLIDGVELLDTC